MGQGEELKEESTIRVLEEKDPREKGIKEEEEDSTRTGYLTQEGN